jgi:nucleotidyltransferase/DNA polymerase involved in DNA repair
MARPSRTKARAGATPASGPIVAIACTPVPLVQAWWRADPTLRTMPLVIAPPERPILAVCPLAREVGIQPGQQLAQARLRCPGLQIRPPEPEAALALYERLLDALAGCSPVIEAADPVAGVAYLDARGLSRLWGDLPGVARVALRAAAGGGLHARAGIGPTRLVALALARRAAGGADAPVLLGDEVSAFLRDLPLGDGALGLSPAVVQMLQELGVTTAGTLAGLPQAGLALRFPSEVLAVWRAARGLAEPPLRPWTPPERLAVGHRVEEGLEDWTIVEAVLRQLAARLSRQLRARAHVTATLTLSLRCTDGAEHLRRARHWPPVQAEPALTAAALDLLGGCRPGTQIEAIELQATDFAAPDAIQQTLWGDAARDRRGERLAAVLQTQARRHGRSMLRRWRPDPLAAEGWTCEEGAAG